MKYAKYFLLQLTVLITGTQFISCKKLVDVDPPPNQISQGNVYDDDVTATAVLTGIYTKLSQTSNVETGFTTITRLAGLSADEFDVWSGYSGYNGDRDLAYFKNALFSSRQSSPGSELWAPFYNLIFTCNSAIEGLTRSEKLTPSTKQQLLGEAKFLRALFYFYLVNLYGDVPIAISTDFKVNANLARAAKADVYQFIIRDLKEAESLLNINYVDGRLKPYSINNSERVRPNKFAASALLSRAYLYSSDWANAEIESSKVIDNLSLYSLTSLDSAFLKNSNEAIWQLQPVTIDHNTEDAMLFNLLADPVGLSYDKPFYLSQSLMNSFENGDNRKSKWIGTFNDGVNNYYFSFKYKEAIIGAPVTEYFTVLRLSEQFLIRAEARAKLGKLYEAADDLNLIRRRAGLANTSANTGTELLDAILKERRIEFFAELGHRWLDLKRSNIIDSVMASAVTWKGGTWQSYQQLYPIPNTEIERAPNIHQNPGY